MIFLYGFSHPQPFFIFPFFIFILLLFLLTMNLTPHRRSRLPVNSPSVVIKRDNREEPCDFGKITRRITHLSAGLKIEVNRIAQQVIADMVDRMHVSKLDDLIAETSASMALNYGPDYNTLAARITVSNMHKETPSLFSEAVLIVHYQQYPLTDEKRGRRVGEGFYDPKFVRLVRKHASVLDAAIKHNNDYNYDYFGIHTLMKNYLNRVILDSNTERIIERPQYLLMRVALFLNQNNINAALQTYQRLSAREYTHASPTLFNAGKKQAQMASCFLMTIKDDSIDGIYSTIKQCAIISKNAGGIGIAISKIRANGSVIKSSNGRSDGIVPMLKVFESTALYCNQGGGKRKGAFAIYLEPWHADIRDFIQLRLNRGHENRRTRDLFLGLWVCDLFMKRVENDQPWTLFCPTDAPGLFESWGEEFEALYEKYEREGRGRHTIQARELFTQILDAQIETGMPYMLFKDACNRKSNQQNLGTIQCSNLCAEIVEYTSKDEVAVCNLASVALPSCVISSVDGTQTEKTFDHQKLYDITYLAIQNLNNVLDITYYPVTEAKRSNTKHRPVGLGVVGLADVFAMMRLPFTSPQAQQLNREIFETMYFAALKSSCDLARTTGMPYETFQGSPLQQGQLQFDLWDDAVSVTDRWNWDELRQEIKQYGVKNSLLLSVMPTASTGQIMGYNECIEPFTRNMYMRSTNAGDFVVFNTYLVQDMRKRNLWTPEIIEKLIAHQGSIQNIEEFEPYPELKKLYVTAYDMPIKPLIDMAADRGRFICQTQSFNIFDPQPTRQKLFNCHMHSWKRGLKTGMYYLRSQSAVESIQFSLDATLAHEMRLKNLGVSSDSSTMLRPTIKPQVDDEKSTNSEKPDALTLKGILRLSDDSTEDSTPKTKPQKKYQCTDEVCLSCQC